MLLYVASDVGGVNGAPQAARDILISLLLSGYPVTVISNNRCELPERVDGIKLPSPNWITPVKKNYFPKKRDRYFFTNFKKWFWSKSQSFFQKQYLQWLNPKVIFVNGLNSHKLWKNFNLRLTAQNALVVHMSPRHCQYNNTLTLDNVLTDMKDYSNFVFVSSTCQKEWLSLDKFDLQNSYYIPNCCKENIVNNLIL